jgi:virginiamycin B lyase
VGKGLGWAVLLLGIPAILVAQAVNISEYQVPAPDGTGITTGPDGALWYAVGAGKIGRMTSSGAVTEYTVPTSGSVLGYIAARSDGAMWFTEIVGNKIGRITMAGAITGYALPAIPTPTGVVPR